jgi:hypothetical protein
VKVVSDHRAKWLPSRHRFALSKLIALAMFRGDRESQIADRESRHRYVFAIDRDQSTAEAFAVATLVFVTTAADLAALLPIPLWASIPIALLVTPWFLQIPLYAAGVPFHSEKVNSVVIMSVPVALSLWIATKPTPLRFVALAFLGILALNAIAWLIVQPLRGRMQKLEQECGV